MSGPLKLHERIYFEFVIYKNMSDHRLWCRLCGDIDGNAQGLSMEHLALIEQVFQARFKKPCLSLFTFTYISYIVLR